MRLAIIKNGVVVNIAKVLDGWTGDPGQWQAPPDVTVVESDTAGVGDLYDGSVFSRDESRLATATREALVQRFRAEALARIAAQVPAWDTFERIEFLLSIANMLNTAAMTAAQNQARLVLLYARDTAVPKLAGLTLAQLETVQPSETKPFASADPSDAGWPA